MALWMREDAHPLALDIALNKKYGEDWLEWEGETIFMDLTEAGEDIPEVNKQKIQALRAIRNTDLFWSEWPAFTTISMALNGIIPDASITERPTLSEMAFAVQVARVLRDMPFDDELSLWIAAEAEDEGVPWLPLPLSFANQYLNPRKYKCKSCGTEGDVLPDGDSKNTVCETCSGMYRTLQPFSIDLPEWGKKNLAAGVGVGDDIKTYDKHGLASAVREEFMKVIPSKKEADDAGGPVEAVMKKGWPKDQGSITVPTAKVLTIIDYLYDQSKAFKEQSE
jgi:hypothetical protein